MEALTKEIDALKASRNALQDKIDSAMGLNKNGGEIGTAIAELSKLRAAKGKLIDERKAIRAQLDGIKTQTDKLVKDRKDTRSSIKFSTVEEIDEEIAKLVRKHETTSMSLTDEKKMLKGFIDASGFGITPACRRYLEPLVRGEAPPPYGPDGLPKYVRLKLHAVAKKLPAFD